MNDFIPPRKPTRWAVRLPIILAAYHLTVFVASFFIPWGLVEIAEFPVARPLQVLWPWVKSLFEAALGAAPGELAQLTLTIALALAVWMAYGWVIGAYLDFRNAASVRREAAVSLPPA